MSLHLSKCHIVGNHMSLLIFNGSQLSFTTKSFLYANCLSVGEVDVHQHEP